MRKKIKSILIKFLSFTILLESSFAYSKNASLNIRSIGKSHLQLSKDLEVEIEDFDEVAHETHREWKTRIILKRRGKTIFKKYPIENEALDSTMFYFVPILNEKYLIDLNGDGQKEFAVVHEHGGNAPTTSATIFSLDNKKLKISGETKLNRDLSGWAIVLKESESGDTIQGGKEGIENLSPGVPLSPAPEVCWALMCPQNRTASCSFCKYLTNKILS